MYCDVKRLTVAGTPVHTSPLRADPVQVEPETILSLSAVMRHKRTRVLSHLLFFHCSFLSIS